MVYNVCMKIELLGKGNMGSVHADCYTRIPEVEVVRQVGKIAPQDLLKDSIDAVDVCYPSEVHKKYVIEALNNGKHVFCETPLAITLEDADDMIASAKANKKILMVGLLMRSIAEYQEIEKRVKSGELGKIKSVHAYRLSNYMTAGSPANRPHYGDVVSELMTFDIDFLNLLFGLPTSVTATGKNDVSTNKLGEAISTVEYSDVDATVEASAIKPLDFPFSIGISIVGEKEELNLKTVFTSEIPETILIQIKDGVEEKIEVDGFDPYEHELRYFMECVENKKNPSRLSAERAREALQVVVAIGESIKNNKPQML